MKFGFPMTRLGQRALLLLLAAAVLWPTKAGAQARSLARGVGGFRPNSSTSSSTSTVPSQSDTAATTATAQSAQAAATAGQAQAALARSLTQLIKLQAAQQAAHMAATAPSTVVNGIGAGGLFPQGGTTPLTGAPAIQMVDLSTSGKNQLVLSNGGTVALPNGTTGTDQISITGAGTVTTTSGNVTATAGSLTTTSGGTLNTTANGGSISLTAGSATLSATTTTNISSNVAGSYTFNGATTSFAANTPTPIPAGATVSFTGSSTAQVTVKGAATVQLSGAGTLALTSAAAGSGGTITTNSGSTSFTNAVISSESAGTTISLTGGGSISYSGASGNVLPLIVEPVQNATTQQLAVPSFATTGNLLTTTGYTVPTAATAGSAYGWSGVSALSQSTDSSTGRIIDTVTQDAPEALLYWQSFNIGPKTTLDFDQSAGGANVGNWVAINRITAAMSPSTIFGAIEAPGQVYVINQNGILFTGSAQVNTHALVASTLPINSDLAGNSTTTGSGLLNNPNGEFLFSSVPVTSQGTTLYNPGTDPDVIQGVSSGSIIVQEGANLFSPGSPEGVGGKIALIAPQIDNQGSIESDDGQVILAAGEQVGFVAHPTQDPSLRGLDVSIGAVSGNESVTNDTTGLLYAPEGDITVTAPAIVQKGIIESTTSVALNGRIDLLAISGLAWDPGTSSFDTNGRGSNPVGGTIELAPGSLTEVLPDYTGTNKQVGTSLALPSQVYVEGGSFQMDGATSQSGGAELIAPNATTTFSLGIANTFIDGAGSNLASTAGETTTPLPENTGVSGSGTFTSQGASPAYLPNTTGSFSLGNGALVDVSGSSGVQASVTENIVQVQLTAAVLENSSLQRTGALHGATVTVDISQTGTNADGSTWYGSPIGDLSGYANLVEHSVGELTVAGGSVNINTNGAVNLGQGSTINVSGGSVDYQGANVDTSQLVTKTGQIVNISLANPNVVYTGVYNGFTTSSSKWGVSQSSQSSTISGQTYDPGYVQGGAGGSLNISAASFSMNGSLYGNTTAGVRQQQAPPKPSSLVLTVQRPTSNPATDPAAINFVIQPSSDAASTDPNTVDLSPDLFGVDGFSNATIYSVTGNLTVAPDAQVSLLPGGSFNTTTTNADIEGKIIAPSGTISITATPQLPSSEDAITPYNSQFGNLIVGSQAVVSTAGLVFDELSGTPAGTLPFAVNGGKISLNGAVTALEAGSVVDASAGLALSAAGHLYQGKAGSIALSGYYDNNGSLAGQLSIDPNATLSAYGIGSGGSLTLAAPSVVVTDTNATGTQINFQGTPLILQSSFFSEGGFSNFTIKGESGLQIADGITIAPVLTEAVADTTAGQFGLNLVSASQLPSYPAAPVNLTFSAQRPSSSDPLAELTVGTNASIVVPATSSVVLNGQTVDLLGKVSAPGGSISVTGTSTGGLGISQTGSLTSPVVTVYLGPNSSLSTDGQVISTTTTFASHTYHVGQVLAGGTITLAGNIVGAPGATLSANGAVGSLDVPVSSTTSALQAVSLASLSNPYVHETIASNGGSISILGDELAYFGGSVSARPGNSTATGGTLTFGSGLATSYTAPPNSGYAEVYIKQTGTFSTGSVTPGSLGSTLTGTDATDSTFINGAYAGGGAFTVQQFADGGFGSLILKGNVKFEGSDTISASKEVEILPDSTNGTIFADGSSGESVSITAPYIEIGCPTLTISQQTVNADGPPYIGFSTNNGSVNPTPAAGLADPTYGGASLTLNATDLIDVGFLSLQNIGVTNLSVPTGDIRGGGLFYAAGAINMKAGQIYTPTAATFTVAAFGADDSINGGTIDINPGTVVRPLPYSAGGTINVYATTINQDGTLVAPFGVINLGAAAGAVLPGITYIQDVASQLYIGHADDSQTAPVTQSLTLGAGSVTSVSGVSADGSEVLDLPYGTILNGQQWIAPNGADITSGGLPAKAVNLNGYSIDVQAANKATGKAAALINVKGGGDLFAYDFNPGVGGTNDILSIYKYANGQIVQTSSNVPVSSNSFAIVPTYGLDYAPIDLTIDSNGAFPYANSSITSNVGGEIYLAGGDGIAAGDYAILPARYALLGNGYLVTPTSSVPTKTSVNPDGSINMAGYTLNSLNASQQLVPTLTGYTIDSNAVVNQKAPYTVDSANTFLAAGAQAASQSIPRLPQDAGQVVFDAIPAPTGSLSQLTIQGQLLGNAGPNGLGSIVDISSSDDIYIVSSQADTPTLAIPAGTNPDAYSYLTLSASDLNNFGADSLLIGGTRTASGTGFSINPLTNAIYVQNDTTHLGAGETAAVPLQGNEIILASNQTINLDAGASIQQSGVTSRGTENISIGNAKVSGSGDGVLLAVSGNANITLNRSGVDPSVSGPNLTIGADASVSGVAAILDSSNATTIDPHAQLDQSMKTPAQTLILSSGTVSLQVDPTITVPAGSGLVLQNSALSALAKSVKNLTLSSYSTINLYGAGTIGGTQVQSLSLQAAGILGLNNNGGNVTISAQKVTLGNAAGQPLTGQVPSASGGTLQINGDIIDFTGNTVAVDGFSNVQLNANSGMQVSGTGEINTQGSLTLATPLVTGATGANYTFVAQTGTLALTQLATTGTSTVTTGLGASIALQGPVVNLDSRVYAPSGTITATAGGALEVQSQASLDASGKAVNFGSSTGYTSGGEVSLTSTGGNVVIDAATATGTATPPPTVNVSAPAVGGNAGTLAVSAVNGSVTIAAGSIQGTASTGTGGTFEATLGTAGTLSGLTTPATAGGFTSMNFDVLGTGTVVVDGAVGGPTTQSGLSSFSVTSETGAITVTGTINATGTTGGTVDLYADGGVKLASGSKIDVWGKQLNDAGKGGSIDIETRGDNGGVLNIAAGSQMVLGVGTGTASIAAGTVHLRAPQTLGGVVLAPNSTSVADGVAMDAIAGTINGESSVTVEGYRVYQPANGVIDSTLENQVATDVASFPTATIAQNLGVANNALFQIEPGIEITNPNGNLTFGTVGQNTVWDLSGVRTSTGLPGILTLRASGNLSFNGSLTDGFYDNQNDPENTAAPYTWDLLPVGSQSWSYRLVAGAAFNVNNPNTSAANFGEVVAQSAATSGSLTAGSLELGQVIPANFKYGLQTSTTANLYAQMIRTGTGDITIDAGGSVYLLNQMATIYTAGQQAAPISNFNSPTSILGAISDTNYAQKIYTSSGTVTIIPTATATYTFLNGGNSVSIPYSTQYTAQYSENGGDVAINADQDIAHMTLSSGTYTADTSWQFPTNWLYRRGATAGSGAFDSVNPDFTKTQQLLGLNLSETASTTWWVDFSNFFEGIGALGGGNVSLHAGNNIINVDAVVPTNERTSTQVTLPNGTTSFAAADQTITQLGGGDLSVIAGNTIEGGTYYVEQGTGLIEANNITSAGDTARISAADQSDGTPLPLTLFVGDSHFTVNATNTLSLGSAVNPFMLPQGIGNGFADNTVFSTYGADSSVQVSSLLGSITIQGSEADGQALPGSLYQAYLSNASPTGLTNTTKQEKSGTGTPWTLTLAVYSAGGGGITNRPDSIGSYTDLFNFAPPVFGATAFSQNIQLNSDLRLAPSKDGTAKLLAGGSVEGAFNTPFGNGFAATVTILNDNPSALPGITNPFGYGRSTVEPAGSPSVDPAVGLYIANIGSMIGETASYQLPADTLAVLQSQNTPGLLHDNTPTQPVQIGTINGNIEDLTLISGEKVDITSGQDIQDVSFYIQNNNANDISVVSANRNITLYDPNSLELLNLNQPNSQNAAFGDIQLGGPGTLEVLAGGNLDLGQGVSPNATAFPGTNLGIVTIGGARDPYLQGLGGASIIAAAGLGNTSGLDANPQQVNYNGYTDSSGVYHPGFITDYLDPTASPADAARYLPDLGSLLGLNGATNQQVWDIFSGTSDTSLTSSELALQASMTQGQRDALASTIFYDVLRDSGRDHNNPSSSSFGSYQEGYAAIKALFPSSGNYAGNISLTSREFKTDFGGDIGLLVPGGQIDVGVNNLGAQAQDQGILTVDGGNISIFTNNDVNVGTSRIFTLHGGNIIIWSSVGSIDAGASSRTVQSAPPTQVLVDSQSANVRTDLAGLATGGGIGVLETVVGAPPGNVDLIAPVGTVNAGDAGIRASGNINVAAAQVLNAGNIQAGGSKSGVPSSSTPNIAATVAATSAAGSAQNAATASQTQQQSNAGQTQDVPSIISVDVLGYGGGDDDSASTETPSDRKSTDPTYLAARPSEGSAARF